MESVNSTPVHDVPYTRTLGRPQPDEPNIIPSPSASDHTARASFASHLGRLTRGSPWRKMTDEELASPGPGRPPIPSALAPGESASTSLPVLPMVVLSIVMLGEFLSANVSMPFLLFMVEGFGNFHDEADVGYWTGILVSCFFITQFLTSLLWATVSEKHGARIVLFSSLLGSSLTCFAFGTSKSLPQAICIRLLQGVFAGAIGVGRGTVATITDPSNEGRAYAVLGFCWGFGGVAGAIIGGSFETPTKKWPDAFARWPIFATYPYLLPTAIASMIIFVGALLSLLLGPDGGPREGGIRLPAEKIFAHETIEEESDLQTGKASSYFIGLGRLMPQKLSRYFVKHDVRENSSPSAASRPTVPVRLSSTTRVNNTTRNRALSRTSQTNGSAYGYGGGYRSRVASNLNQSLAGRRGSLASTIARRRTSNTRQTGVTGESGQAAEGELNIAQRLLMANEFAVNNIADLWVAAAINADNEDPFLSDSETESNPFQEDEDERDVGPNAQSPDIMGSSSVTRLSGSFPSAGRNRPSSSAIHRPSTRDVRSDIRASHHTPSPVRYTGAHRDSNRRASSIPAIFSHTGIRSSPTDMPASPGSHQLLPRSLNSNEETNTDTPGEAQIPRHLESHNADELTSMPGKQPSLLSQLPLAIITQYGLLALHSTTHDQIFLSYLVSKYQNGGLNLKAGNFAQLIALMSLASIFYQFFLYPNMGPPRGRFSHLAMFRVGSLLFIPAYLSVTLYRPLASSDGEGSVLLMGALVISTTLRYAGITFAYTAVAILLNYMSPPHILGYANGIAQSIVSFARFVGPILGGYLWSKSVEGNASGYPLGFIVCSCVTALAVGHSFFIR